MTKRYKAILSGRKLYKEVELPVDGSSVQVGTTAACDVRLHKGLFFEQFELVFSCAGDEWLLRCSENIYVTDGEVRKLAMKKLAHGDELSLRYHSSSGELLHISFMLDFDTGRRRYDRCIDLSGQTSVQIGGRPGCQIYINDPAVGEDTIRLVREDGQLYVVDSGTRYEVYVNGVRVAARCALRERDFLSLAGCSFYFRDGQLYGDASCGMTVNGLPYTDTPETDSPFDYPKFSRNTRKKTCLSTQPVEILDPPAKREPPKGNFITKLIPTLAMIVLIVLVRGVMGGGGSFILFSVCSMAVGLFTSVGSMIAGKRDYKKKTARREESYRTYIQNKRAELEALRREERSRLDEIYLPLDREMEMLRSFSGALFDRRSGDMDFLQVRLGSGDVASQRPVQYKKHDELEVADELAALPKALHDEFELVPGAPVVSDFASAGAVGVVGGEADCGDMLRRMALDLCLRQYSTDVKLVFIGAEADAPALSWARWLRHVRLGPQQLRGIVCDEESRNALFEYLYSELGRRAQSGNTAPRIVIFVLDGAAVRSHPLSRQIPNAAELGFTFVFFERFEEFLPQGCGEIVRLNGQGGGTHIHTDDSGTAQSFTCAPVPAAQAEQAALRLAPVYCEQVGLENSLTRSITMFEMLNILSADDIDLEANWRRAAVYNTMAAPLGVKTKDEIVYLDLHEKAHGPHGLVAGTTGSGKSELLLSYILSMSVLYHPHEVSFVIIDFKGGGMANQLRGLPHLIGTITNIDGREIERSLRSIKAELRKRQRVFAEAGVSDIGSYIKHYKAGRVAQPLPHLIIVVDEFAELKGEHPEFMKELISAARIGRSLGVHLILATQKPSGQVSEQIWSNSRFKLCLKVQTKEDSVEVIKSPLAAEIREPGRTYLQVGNNEVFELFQSAYSGAPASGGDGFQSEFTLSEVSLTGHRRTVYQQKNSAADSDGKSQLTAIVEHVQGYCRETQVPQLEPICLPALEKCIRVGAQNEKFPISALPIGVYDDPDNQYQGEATVNLEGENLLIVGASQTGKTTLLQTIIRQAASWYSPAELNIYALDFGTMVLGSFAELAHVGGVVGAAEEDRVKNLFKFLRGEIGRRKARLAGLGLSSHSAYVDAGYTDTPRILLLLDNFTLFRELCAERYEGEFLYICREGPACGVSTVLTNTGTASLSYRYLTNFSGRIALSCNDKTEYAALLDRCRMEPGNMPGRGLFMRDKQIYELQCYLSFEGEREIDRVSAIRDFIREANARWPGMRAAPIPAIPARLSLTYIDTHFAADPAEGITVALDYETVDRVTLGLTTAPQLALMGADGPRREFLCTLLDELGRHYFQRPAEIRIIDDYDRPLQRFARLPYVKQYTVDPGAAEGALEQLHAKLLERRQMLADAGSAALREAPLLVLVLNSRQAVDELSASKQALERYKEITSKLKNLKLMLIFADVEDASVPFSGQEILKKLKEERRAVIFGGLRNHKFFDLPVAQVRAVGSAQEAGDACYVAGAELRRIKYAQE